MNRSLSLALANINARISHLAESKSAALEHAHTAAGTAAGEHPVAEELLRCVIPEGQSLEGHQHRTHLRLQSAVELLIVGINGQLAPGGIPSRPIGITTKARPGYSISSFL